MISITASCSGFMKSRLMAAMLAHTSVNAHVCQAAASDPQLLATDLADYLVNKGVPFREAHHTVGAVVRLADELQKPLDKLTLAEFQGADARFGPDVTDVFDLEKAMGRRKLTGAPGTAEVWKQLEKWKRQLAGG